MNSEDPFSGIWKLNPEKSHFDSNHRPTSGTMLWEATSEGYVMRAEGTTSDGKVVQEQPTTFILDGKDHPVGNVPGISMITSRPTPNALEVESKNVGSIVGKASYVVSGDRTTLTATVSSLDAQERRFRHYLVWDRQ